MIRIVGIKLAKYQSFWKFAGLHTVSIVLLVYVASKFSGVDVQNTAIQVGELFVRPEAWKTVCALARWLFIIPAFFTIQLVCAELELKLVRSQVISGLEIHEIVLAWLLQNVILVLIGVVATILAVITVSVVKPGMDAGWMTAVTAETGFFLYGFVFLAGAVMCAVLMRRPVPSIVLLCMGPAVIEPILGALFERYGLAYLVEYLPFASMAKLVPWGTASIGGSALQTATIAVCLAYGVLASFVVWLRLSRLDL